MILANVTAAVIATAFAARLRGWKIRRMTNNAGSMN